MDASNGGFSALDGQVLRAVDGRLFRVVVCRQERCGPPKRYEFKSDRRTVVAELPSMVSLFQLVPVVVPE